MSSLRSALPRALSLFALLLATPGLAHEYEAGAIAIGHPWSRATPPGARTGAGYLTLTNNGAAADRLVSASSPAAPNVEIHSMSVNADGVMIMRAVPDGISVAPGARVVLAPGGLHLMLIGLAAPFREGGKVPVTLVFEKAGAVTVDLHVDKLGAGKGAAAGEGAHVNH